MMEFPSYYYDNNPFTQNYYTPSAPPLRRPSVDPYNPYTAAPSSSTLFDDFFTPCTPPHPTPTPTPTPQPRQRRMVNPRRYSVPKTTPHQQESRKIINIPVVGPSDEKVVTVTRSDYAIRIQKVFRGFRVRKNVRKIMELKSGIDSVEKKFSDKEYVELMKSSDFERLKVNEALMALLLKLDAVTSCNDAVKICRKSVVRKAIILQEKIDSFAVAAADIGETLDGGETSEETNLSEEDVIMEEVVENSSDCSDNADDSGAETIEKLSETTGKVSESEVEDEEEKVVVAADETSGGEADSWDLLGDEKEVEFIDIGEKREGEAKWMIQPVTDEWFVVDESKENKKLMEKLAADNKTLVAMVADLCRKNAEQALLIDSLTRRVELLEQRR